MLLPRFPAFPSQARLFHLLEGRQRLNIPLPRIGFTASGQAASLHSCPGTSSDIQCIPIAQGIRRPSLHQRRAHVCRPNPIMRRVQPGLADAPAA